MALLIFDEAHHAKKDHPYSRLIRSYYLKCPIEERPKIFGMTASAVDTKGDITETAEALEQLLHSKIVTTSDGSLLSFAPKPIDVRWIYPRLHQRMETELYATIFEKASFCEDLKRGFDFAKKFTKELGPWCADHVWLLVMGTSHSQSSGIRRKYEQSEAYAAVDDAEERSARLQALEEAAMAVQSQILAVPTLSVDSLSTKVLMLYEKLTEHFERNPSTRAIVFVEERLKALVLHECFLRLETPNMRSGTLLGIAGSSAEHVSLKAQEETLERFRSGLINLMFATSVADEGLDIPQCNLCIRFDLCKTTIQYMQSRGRARMKDSTFAHMMEDGAFAPDSELTFQIENEAYLKKWCATLAPDRRLGQGTKLSKLLAKDDGGKTFKTDNGAVCDNSNSLLILSRFASSLRHVGATDKEVYEEEIDVEQALFRYTARLPENEDCHVKGCRGEWKTSKQLAKRSAAWACCYLLRQKGHLDDSLDSIHRKYKPENSNARLSVTSKKSAYDMQTKPSLWQAEVGTIPTTLFATILHFEPEKSLKHPCAPMIMLTRTSLPEFPQFPAYLEDKVKTMINLSKLPQPLQVSKEQLDTFTNFTLQGVFMDVFNKGYDHEPEMMSYWLVPLSSNADLGSSNIENIVDPAALNMLPESRKPWSAEMLHAEWENKFLSDPYNGKFHYFTSTIQPNVSIYDPVSSDIPKISQKKRTNIIDFSNSAWTATKKKLQIAHVIDDHQPVLSADLVGTRRNFLGASVGQDLITCLIAPQFLEIGRIKIDAAASCVVWPAIIHRLESYMIVLEAFEKLNLPNISAGLALEAFTKDADNPDEEQQTHTGGRRGMGKNYERLEFIGDSLLKMTTTISVFLRTKCDEEGMHCRRMELLCNRTLFNVSTAGDLQLYRYARTLGFDRTTWYPEFLKLRHGRGAKKEPEPNKHEAASQYLGMKTIADMSEAIIGAAVIATYDKPLDEGRFDLPIQAITKLVRSPDHDVTSWIEMIKQYKAPAWSLRENDPVAKDRAQLVFDRTGYKFNHPCLLRSAFTHSSDTNSPVPDLQRLEFLGDAVLDYVCISWLFFNNPTRDPQWLTEHKMAMVTNKFLAALAVTLDFDKFIFATTAKLLGDITVYAEQVRAATAVPDYPKNFWMEISSPPKALSDLVESYLGAVFVDSGFNYREMEKFFDKHVKQFFENITDYDSFANREPTTYLHSRLGQDFKCRSYKIFDMEDPKSEGAIEPQVISAVLIHARIVSDSKGTSKRYARVRASKNALSIIEGMTRDEFRARFNCTCALIKSDE